MQAGASLPHPSELLSQISLKAPRRVPTPTLDYMVQVSNVL